MVAKIHHDIPALWMEALGPQPDPAPSAAKTHAKMPPLTPAVRMSRTIALEPWTRYAVPALARPRPDGASVSDGGDPPRTFSARRFASEPALWATLPTRADTTVQLTTLLRQDAATIIDAIGRGLVTMQDVPIREVLLHVGERLFRGDGVPVPSGVSVDTRAIHAFIMGNLSAIMDNMRARLDERRRDDVAELTTRLADNPHLSLHELWVSDLGKRRADTSAYFRSLRDNELAPLLNRPIDRMGDEPNYLLAVHFAHYLIGQQPGATYASAVSGFRELLGERGWLAAINDVGWKDFTTAEADQLRAVYPFVPTWTSGRKRIDDATFADLLPVMRERLAAINRIPVASELLLRQAAIRGERDFLRDSILVTTEHALADKMDLFRHLIAHDGMRGGDIRIVWKEQSADPTVIELAERCFGVKGRVAHSSTLVDADQRLELLAHEELETAVHNANGRTVNVHLQGVRAWNRVGELALRYPAVPINACSHTTSEAPQLREKPPGVERVALSVMAECPAKIRYERYVFTPTFTRLLLDVDNHFESEIGTIRNRNFVVYGGAGRIIGGAVVDALRSQQFATAVIDPFLSTAKGAAKRERLLASGVEILETPHQVRAKLAKDSTFLINATANNVFGTDDYDALGHNTVTMNLGTGQKGFSIEALQQRASEQRELFTDVDRHQRSMIYKIAGNGGKPIAVCALGDGGVFNLGERGPNPRLLSAFNNMLIIESLHQAKFNRDRGQLGPCILDSVRVAFTREERPRPVISFMRRDAAPAVWPREWAGDPGQDPHAAIIISDEGA